MVTAGGEHVETPAFGVIPVLDKEDDRNANGKENVKMTDRCGKLVFV